MEEKRRCIKCQELMVPKNIEEVEVDFCPTCQGIWLDRGEVHQLRAKIDKNIDELATLLGTPSGKDAAGPMEGRLCPMCQSQLGIASFGQYSVEHCLRCGGMFLDPGELNKMMDLIKSMKKPIATVVAMASSVIASGSLGGKA
jgi:uncharacterized protein